VPSWPILEPAWLAPDGVAAVLTAALDPPRRVAAVRRFFMEKEGVRVESAIPS
jgi:hypothetical protein